MESLLTIFGGLGLFFIGVKLIGGSFRQMSGRSFRRLVARSTGSRLRSVAIGTAAGALTQSTNAVTFVIASLITAGMVTVRRAMPVMAAANVGTSALVILAVVDLRLFVLFVLGAIGLCYYFDLDKSVRFRHAVGAMLGLGLLFLGLGMIKAGAAPLRDSEAVRDLVAFAADSLTISFVVGAVLALIVQSSTTVSVVAVTMVAAGVLGQEQTVMIVLGAGLGSGVSTWLLGANLTGTARQLALFQTLTKALGVAVLLALLLVERRFEVPGLAALLALGPRDVGLETALLYLYLQIASCIVALLLEWPLALLLARLSPPSVEERLARPHFLYEQALAEPETALDLVDREQHRLLRHLPQMLDHARPEDEREGDHADLATLHQANIAVGRAIDEFLTDLLDQEHSRAALERAVNARSRNELIAALDDAYHRLALVTREARPSARVATLIGNLIEALHAVTMTVIDAADSGDPGDTALALTLTGDRSDMMDRARRQLMSSGGALSADAQQALFTATGLFERSVWLLRRYAVLLQSADRDTTAA